MANLKTGPTLREALTQRKPLPVLVPRPTPTENTRGPKSKPLEIRSWVEFNLETLDQGYGHVLDLPILDLSLPWVAGSGLGKVPVEKDHDLCHLAEWNDALLKPALHFAKHQLGLHPGVELKYNTSTIAEGKYCTANFS